MLSIGGLGCNFRCPGCQNRELAHAPGPEVLESVPYVSPEALVEQALGRRLLGISFTYNEPAIWFEYTLDTFKLAKHRGLMTNYVTNGSLTLEALNEIGPYLDAYRVDIKGFCETTYERVANFPKLEGILDGAARAKTDWGMHIECVTNVVPTLTDNFQELRGIAHWIASCLGRDTPWHVTRFVPYGDLAHLPQTPVSVLERARGIGLEEGLRFVYLGNVPGHPAENTYCPECGNILIRRSGIGLPETALVNGACPMCRYEVSGRWNE